MNRLRFEIEWEDPAAAVGQELRATWAHLQIFVDDQCLTQVHDLAARSVRNGIYLPLYPLAEWLAMHWWGLFAEMENPRRTPPEDYLRRHNLRRGRDGFAFPDLVFRPLNGEVALAWEDSRDPAGAVRFLARGKALLPAEEVDAALRDLIEAVLRRLDQFGVQATALHEEWQAVTAADAEERSFCRAAAALGLDPYALDEEVSEALLEVERLLPPAVSEEFLASATAAQLLPQARQVAAALKKAGSQKVRLQTMIELRQRIRFASASRQPWEDGYACARRLRRELSLNGEAPEDIDDIGTLFGVAAADLRSVVTRVAAVPDFFDAAMNLNDQQSPGFVLRRQSRENLKFAFCRALFEYLAADQPGPALIAADYSLRQKRNRAFAAEFLVPAELLREALPGDYLDSEAVDALARRFKASPWLVRHQLENHRLARLAPLGEEL
jgi:hypothetical protein